MLWNAPNLLTLLRIFLIPVFIAAYYLPFHWAPLLATVLLMATLAGTLAASTTLLVASRKLVATQAAWLRARREVTALEVERARRERAVAMGELGEKTRNNKLALEDVQGGTFTLDNTGAVGSVSGRRVTAPPDSSPPDRRARPGA